MYEFDYQCPKSIESAVDVLTGQDGAKPLAGGMSLLPALKLRLAQYSKVVDLNGIDAIKGIAREGDLIRIGAMTRHYDVASSSLVQEVLPSLASLAIGIGDPLVRNRGTIGGSIANADPAADYPSAVLALNAQVQTNRRTIAADDFFTGLFETALDANEIITAVRFPVPLAASYVKFPNPASRFALVGVFVAKTPRSVRVAVTGAGPCVFRLEGAEAALSGNFSPSALDGFVANASGLNEDFHATAEYRAHVIDVILRRAVEQIAEQMRTAK